MRSTIYASFADPGEAERAAGALLDHGIQASEISLLAEEGYVKRKEASETAAAPVPDSPTSSVGAHIREEVDQNEVTGSSYRHSVVNDSARPMTTPNAFSMPGSNMAYGSEMAGGLESTDPATHYRSGHEAIDYDGPAPTIHPEDRSSIENVHQPANIQPVADDEPVETRVNLSSATSGITTTTPADAGAGAAKGAAVGMGVGLAAAIASVFIPGLGLIVGGGALATALIGMLGAAGAGVVAGGVVGYLKDQGVPEEAVTVYREAFERGGAILAVAVPPEVNRADVEAVLAKYGAQNVDMYGEVRSV